MLVRRVLDQSPNASNWLLHNASQQHLNRTLLFLLPEIQNGKIAQNVSACRVVFITLYLHTNGQLLYGDVADY